MLHGLARKSGSMRKMQRALEADGFDTCNIGYPSTKHRIEALARDYILPEIELCASGGSFPMHFVTHSLGGIIVRYLDERELIEPIGRVVMFSPPNRGSEVVDKMGQTWLFRLFNGPAGQELGTDSSSVPMQLGPANFELGIVTGSRTINPFLSMMIKGKDDGKVSIERAALEGMQDMLVIPTSHPFIMKNRTAIAQTIQFLKTGAFERTADLD